MARKLGRSQECSDLDARRRREHAQRFLEVAEIVADEREQDPEYASVAVSLAVLAGIAAADAACCRALGERSRGEDHREAERFLERVADGQGAARELRSLLNLKDDANYGFFDVSTAELRRALRKARSLIEFSDRVLSR